MLKQRTKFAIAIGWFVLLAIGVGLWFRTGRDWQDLPALIESWLSQFGLARASMLYIAISVLRPLLLFPAGILTVVAGLVFGPWLGMLLSSIGENASAYLAFRLSRWLGRDWVSEHERGRVSEWDERLSRNAFATVLVMRLINLPFDAVNYGCGLTNMKDRDFALGTALGILPSTLSLVLLGGAGSATATHRAVLFAFAVFFFFVGFAIASLLRRFKLAA